MPLNFGLGPKTKSLGAQLAPEKCSMQRYEVLSNLTLAVGSLQIFIQLIQNTVVVWPMLFSLIFADV